jgi:RNA polymerase sigma-70 factor (ECF subfamily)
MMAPSSYTARATAIEFADLLHEAQMGDEVAFASLMRHYRHFAEVAAQRILRTEEAAADAVQEAMYKVYRALPKFQDGNFRSWLLRIVKNTCYDHLRQQTRRQTLSLEELTEFDEAESCMGIRTTDERENPESMIVQQEAMQSLLAAIDDLPTCHREVVLLVDIHGLDYTEAADYLDVPMGTVKSRLSRARATLRDRLTELGLVPGQVA